jgi:AcrR family transcriptional regulator
MTRNREDTTDRIIDAAFRVLESDGFAGFGINAVARAAGCDKKLIYRYFDGQDGLLSAMGSAVAAEIGEALEPHLLPLPDSYAAMIERLVLALHAFLASSSRARQVRLMELGAPPGTMTAFQQGREQAMQSWLARARGDLVPPASVDAAALNAALIAAVEGLSLFPPVGLDPETAQERARAALQHLVRKAYD